MKKRTRFLTDKHLLLVGAIGAVVVALLIQFVLPRSQSNLRSNDNTISGTRALRQWLEASGFEVRSIVSRNTDLNQIDVLFVLDPLEDYSADEANQLKAWVRDGGILIVSGNPNTVNGLLFTFNMGLDQQQDFSGYLEQSTPKLQNPPVETISVSRPFIIANERTDAIAHFSVNQYPVVASFSESRGLVWLSGSIRPFSNTGIEEASNAQFIMNIMARASNGAVIGFDESLRSAVNQPKSPRGWLSSTSAGWGILALVALTLAYLAMRGRRFGEPMPVIENTLRRESTEYVHAMGNLMRVSGLKQDTLHHYRNQLRRALVKRYALEPTQRDALILQAIAQRDPTVDIEELRQLLIDLSKQNCSEHDLVDAASRVDNWIRKLS